MSTRGIAQEFLKRLEQEGLQLPLRVLGDQVEPPCPCLLGFSAEVKFWVRCFQSYSLPTLDVPQHLPDRYALLKYARFAVPAKSRSLTEFAQRRNISQSKFVFTRALIYSLAVLWIVGGLIRWQSSRSPEYLPQLSGMILFLPAATTAIWLGWKTALTLVDLVTATLVALFSFAAWNGIMLPGLRADLFGKTVVANAIHWSIFFCVGIVTARYLQWGTSIGIWSEEEKARGAANFAPANLSIRKLLLLMGIAAVSTVAYKMLVGPSPQASFRTSVFELFPIWLKPFISAIVGGVLVPVYWFVTVGVLKLRSFRLAGLILWLPCAIFLRWFSNEIYWEVPFGFSGSDALDSGVSIELHGQKYLSPPYPAPPNPRLIWSVYTVEAIVQLSLTLLTLLWFRLLGFRVDFWRRIEKG